MSTLSWIKEVKRILKKIIHKAEEAIQLEVFWEIVLKMEELHGKREAQTRTEDM